MSTTGIDSKAVTTLSESLQNPVSKAESDQISLINSANISNRSDDKVSVSMKEVYKSLTVLSQKVLDRLQEILGDQLPEGLESLRPEDHTPERTAQNIVDGATALMGVYARQHPELEGEELLTAFMKTIRGGIDTGYGQAESILGDIGAFDIDGVKSGIDQTKKLVEEKLKAFEDNYRTKNGIKTDSTSDTKSTDAGTQSTSVNQVA